MRITAIAAVLPEHEMSNEDVIEHLRQGSCEPETPARAKLYADIRRTQDRYRFGAWGSPASRAASAKVSSRGALLK